MVEGGMKCVKYLLFGFNLLFFLAGLGLIIVGAVVATRFKEYFNFFGDSFSAAAIFIVVIGAIVFIIGFFGCCGAYKENYCMVMTFAVLLGIIFILEIAAGIAAFVMKNQVRSLLEDGMQKSLKNYNGTEHKGVTDAWNKIQQDLKCCGVKGPSDWTNSSTAMTHWSKEHVPQSCCKEMADRCWEKSADVFKEGCIASMEDKITQNIGIVGGVGIGLAVVQIVGVILSCCLARSIKKEYDVV